MDEVFYPSYVADANLLWTEGPCEQQQEHEIASNLQKDQYEKTFNDFSSI
jgi:hypothetical protein